MTIAKAIVAAIGAIATAVGTALADDVFGGDDTTTVIAAVVTAALTVYGVWRTPNRPADPR